MVLLANMLYRADVNFLSFARWQQSHSFDDLMETTAYHASDWHAKKPAAFVD